MTHAAYRHGLLVHDTDEELDESIRAFVRRGLAADADVLVHGSRERVDLMRGMFEADPRLTFGLDEELYQAPTRTLFAYQRTLATRSDPREVWVTGTVPLGDDPAQQAAWHRYESAVDAALGAYPFVALCTYDTRTRPGPVVAAALATHRTVSVDLLDRENPEYVEPAEFLATGLAAAPEAPTAQVTAATVVHDPYDLPAARGLVEATAREHSAVSSRTIEQLRVAVSEVATNGLVHGRAPVQVSLWARVDAMTCLVEDCGDGRLDPMTGYRHPEGAELLGLWATRQLVDDLVIGDAPSGGCRVLLTVRERAH